MSKYGDHRNSYAVQETALPLYEPIMQKLIASTF